MNRRQEQAAAEQLRRRAVELGEAGDGGAIPELMQLCRHRRPTVRRAAVSAIGKLCEGEGCRQAGPLLCELLRDPHAQVRQYAAVALGRIQDERALPALRDVVNRPSGPEYVLRAAMSAIEKIDEEARRQREFCPVACSRCGRQVSGSERELSERQFQRVYCDGCFNAVFIERRNFDMKVQNQKTIMAQDRTAVQSRGERDIANWLSHNGIAYHYDDKFQIIQGYAVRPDFYLPRFDAYIEYWGLDTTDYKIGMLLKKKLYQQEGKRLISLYPPDLRDLGGKLSAALN